MMSNNVVSTVKYSGIITDRGDISGFGVTFHIRIGSEFKPVEKRRQIRNVHNKIIIGFEIH